MQFSHKSLTRKVSEAAKRTQTEWPTVTSTWAESCLLQRGTQSWYVQETYSPGSPPSETIPYHLSGPVSALRAAEMGKWGKSGDTCTCLLGLCRTNTKARSQCSMIRGIWTSLGGAFCKKQKHRGLGLLMQLHCCAQCSHCSA